jgi:hypothetical protein
MPTTRHLCPLPDCGWHCDDNGPTDRDTRDAAHAPDLNTWIQQTMLRKAARIDALIEAHVSTHTTLEWMTEVARLQSALSRLGYDPLTLQPRTAQEPPC